MLYEVLLLVAHVSMISSSIVVDSTAQRSVYVTDYCPKMKFCAEGAHVMCMYYDSKSLMGPRCSNAQNISMTQELANKLLDVSNAVRGRIAQGKERGKHGHNLPRGFGIFKLNWDTELATFAQVLANQCVLRHDLCRATKRFPDPGQTAGLVRFTYPDWFPVSKSGNFTTAGLDSNKLLYATTQILKSWYGQKNSVTPDMITIYPDWSSNPNNQDGRLYMEMIYGSATHMGCGISGYTEYAFHDNNALLNYNSIQIICNYSARPKKGTAVYNTVPPGDTAESFSRCGCPAGSEGDENCLCQMVQKKPFETLQQLKQEIKQCPEGQVCDPTVVVLPIFTVEDAPPEKLFHHDSLTNTSLRRPVHNSIFQSGYDAFQSQRNFYEPDKTNEKPQAYEYKDKSAQKQSRTQNIRQTSHHQAIRNRYFDKKHMEKQESGSHGPRNARKKPSVFSRAAKFELPGSLSIRPTKQSGIKDVVPRKDFTMAKQLVSKYLYGKNDLLKPEYNKPMIDTGVDKHEELSHLNVHLPMPRETIEHPMSNKKNNFGNPLFKEIHDVKNTFVTQPNDEIKNVAPLFEQHEMKNVAEKEHHLHEVFNILNATKPKMRYEIANYQNIQRPATETLLNRAEQNVIIQDAFLKQIEPKEEPLDEKFATKKTADADRRSDMNLKYENSTRDRDEIDRYDEKTVYTKRGGFRGMRHRDISNEQRNNDYERYQDYGERKRFRNNDFDRNTLTDVDEPRHKGTDIKYRSRNTENDRRYRDDEPEHRNDNKLDHRNMNENYHRNSDLEKSIRKKNYYMSNDEARNDPLSIERRRFYQNKLDNIERKLQMRNYKRRKDKTRHMRPVRPSARKSESQMDIYGRGRLAHGY